MKKVMIVGVLLATVLSVRATHAHERMSACERASSTTDEELKGRWQELCDAEQRAELRDEWNRRLERNAEQQKRMSDSIDSLLDSTFCSQKPYPYTGLCVGK